MQPGLARCRVVRNRVASGPQAERQWAQGTRGVPRGDSESAVESVWTELALCDDASTRSEGAGPGGEGEG